MGTAIGDLGVKATAAAVRSGDLDATARVRAALARIATIDPRIGAFLDVYERTALQQARCIDAHPHRAELSLAGVPVAVKDNICCAGYRVTAGSRLLESYVSPYDATCVERLVTAGAVVVGKTNLDEFAMGSSTERSALGRTVNPAAPDRVPGGSSGGSAAAVAAGMVPAALGSDTGGSVRQPAALCGIAGLKPTYGRVSRYGLIAHASSFDHVGVLAADTDDCAAVLEAIAGHDPLDATSLETPWTTSVDSGPLRLGVPAQWLQADLDPQVHACIEATVEALRADGVEVQTVDLPHQRYALPTYVVIAAAEASSNLARYDGLRYGVRAPVDGDAEQVRRASRSAALGPEVQRRILLGTYVLSAGYRDRYYARAQRVRTLIRAELEALFTHVDAIIGPTSPTTAFRLGERLDDPLSMALGDVFTVSANLTGLPALSVPCGTDDSHLPVGLQVLGPRLGEDLVCRVGCRVEALAAG